jgi:hypothetical protein
VQKTQFYPPPFTGSLPLVHVIVTLLIIIIIIIIIITLHLTVERLLVASHFASSEGLLPIKLAGEGKE